MNGVRKIKLSQMASCMTWLFEYTSTMPICYLNHAMVCVISTDEKTTDHNFS